MNIPRHWAHLAALLLLPTLFANAGNASQVYFGGPIISMDAKLGMLEAVKIEHGKISAVGPALSLKRSCLKSAECSLIDLQGKTLMPGFIDAHGHYSMTLDNLAFSNIASAPVGTVKNISDIIDQLKNQKNNAAWVMGAGYDDSLLQEQRHPNRHDLDQVSTEKPVFIRHVSGHLGVCNSVCLKLAGINSRSKNPEGGVYRREAGSQQPNGVLEEKALDAIAKLWPKADLQQQLARIPELNRYYAQYGITTVQDGATSTAGLDFLAEAAKRKLLTMDVVAYPYYNWVDLSQQKYQPGKTTEYHNGYRIGGIKLVLDGSPQGKTAWLAHPYHIPPKGQDKNYRGYAIVKDSFLKETLGSFYKRGWKIMAHANGDEAAEQMLNVMSDLKNEGIHQPRSVMIHAQTVRDDQLDRMNALDIIPSFFVAHTFYWGDWHRDSVLGQQRASRISPLHSASTKNIRYTIHNDTPIVPPDMALLLWTAVNRETRSGKILGKAQRATVMQALKAITINAAYQHFEEDQKGSIKVGKLADLVILDRNPLQTPAQELRHIKVMQTIKAGKIIYTAQ